MMTGIHPIALVRRLIALPGIWAENRRKAQLARADEREKLAIQGRKLAKRSGENRTPAPQETRSPALAPAFDPEEEVAPSPGTMGGTPARAADH